MSRGHLALLLGAGLGLAACGSDAKPDQPDAGVPAPDATTCDFTGTYCVDNLLETCAAGELQIDDCGQRFATCRHVPALATDACVDACAEAGVTVEGVCTATGARRCEVQGNQHVVVTETCDPDQACTIPSGGAAACRSTDPCAGIGPEGRCAGDTLTRCSNGVPTDTSCGASSQTCAYVDATTGFGCVSASTLGALSVAGTVRYEDRPQQLDGSLGPIGQRPARGVEVSVVADADSAVLATGHTADDGSYVLRYDAGAGALVHVLATTQSKLAVRRARVLKTTSLLYGFGGASFPAAAAVHADILVTDASTVSEAFNIFDQLVRALDAIRTIFGGPPPPALTARWTKDSTVGTNYNVASKTIFLLGNLDGDDDGYDDTVILHETGHFVEHTLGRNDSPGGPHTGVPADPRLAWSEGFSTYWAMVVRGAPVYMDFNASGGWGVNADTATTLTPLPDGGMDQKVSESMITQDLWDLGDSGAGDDDAMGSSSHRDVVRVEMEYLRTATLRAVGASGVDLVDFLDGWFAHAGLAGCAAVRGIVTTTRHFPYDYTPPAGACP